MKELLEEEDKDTAAAAAAAAVSQKKKQAKKAGKERAPTRCRRTRREPKGGTRRGAEGYGQDSGKGCFWEEQD
jgi:ribosomal protein L12E/L44/L45/RPP1/RPP2